MSSHQKTGRNKMLGDATAAKPRPRTRVRGEQMNLFTPAGSPETTRAAGLPDAKAQARKGGRHGTR
jgi:hypothetical protein